MVSTPGIAVTQDVRASKGRKVNVIIGGDYQVGGVTLTVEGEVTFEPQFLLNLEFDWFKANEFTCAFTGQMQGSVSVKASVGHDFLDESFTVARIPIAPITIMAGPVPVVFVPEVNIVVTVGGRVEVSLSAKVGARATATIGTELLAWKWLALDQGRSICADLGIAGLSELDASLSLKVATGPVVSVYLYGLAGPQLDLALFGEIDVNLAPPPLEVLHRPRARGEVCRLGNHAKAPWNTRHRRDAG